MRTTILIKLTGEIRDIRVPEQVHHKICLIQSRSGKKSKGKSIEKKHQIHRNITLQQEHFMYGRKNSRRSCNYQQSNRLFETNLPLSIANH